MVSTIVGYLGVARAYYANGERWGSFAVWDKKRLEPVNLGRVLRDGAHFGADRTLIVAEGNEVDPALLSEYGYKEVGRFSTPSRFAWGENYTVYRSSDGQKKQNARPLSRAFVACCKLMISSVCPRQSATHASAARECGRRGFRHRCHFHCPRQKRR